MTETTTTPTTTATPSFDPREAAKILTGKFRFSEIETEYARVPNSQEKIMDAVRAEIAGELAEFMEIAATIEVQSADVHAAFDAFVESREEGEELAPESPHEGSGESGVAGIINYLEDATLPKVYREAGFNQRVTSLIETIGNQVANGGSRGRIYVKAQLIKMIKESEIADPELVVQALNHGRTMWDGLDSGHMYDIYDLKGQIIADILENFANAFQAVKDGGVQGLRNYESSLGWEN